MINFPIVRMWLAEVPPWVSKIISKFHSASPRIIFKRKGKNPNRDNIPVLMTDVFKLFKIFKVFLIMTGSKVLILNL